jgi:hypothetical protein
MNEQNTKNYFYLYKKYKQKYLELKKSSIIMKGGMGQSLTITNGYNSFRVSSFTQLIKLKKILRKKEGKDWFIVGKKIEKYLNNESYPNEYSSIIAVNDNIYEEIMSVAKYLKIIT